jgi:hypothetical protein
MPAAPNPFGLVPLGAKALKDFRARDEVGALSRLVAADIRRSDLLPFGVADNVVDRVNDLLVQPAIAGGLAKWLDTGDEQMREPLQAQFAQLLHFEEQGVDSEPLAALVVHLIETNLSRAKRSEREAIRLEGERTRRQLKGLEEQVADVGSTLGSSGPVTARSLETARAVVELPPSQADVIEKLVEVDADGAIPLEEALAAGGAQRVVDAIDGSPPWIENSSADVWQAAARLAESAGRIQQAQRGYERAADHPGATDRVRQLVRASNAARMQGDDSRAQELLEIARSEDAGNPAVLLRDAREELDADEKLKLLDQIDPVDDDQAGSVETVRAETLLAMREFGRAREAVARARRLQADTRNADELSASITLTEAELGMPDDSEYEVPSEALVSAAETFLTLANEMQDQHRWYEAAVLTGRAILSFGLAGNSSEASKLLDDVKADGRMLESVDARRLFASGALLLQRLDDVLALVPQSEDETDRLDRAAAHVMSGDAARSAAAVGELTELMKAGGEGSARAAYLLLCASTNNVEVEWNTDAEQLVAAEQPWTVTMLRAFRLTTEGDLEGAETHLRQHSDRPTALRYLVHLAGRREEHEKALRLAETLVQRYGAPVDRLQLAAALARDGRRDTAIDRLLALAHDENVSVDDRTTAYARAARLAQDAEKFPELEDIALEWARHDDSSDPRWVAILAMAMRFRHADALKAWGELGEPEADSLTRALLLSEVFMLAAEPVRALERIATLSDRFERPEELEVGLIFASIRLEEATPELSPELAARIRESYETFFERFPNSTRLRAIPIDPENPAESLIAAFGEQLEHRAEQTDELATGIRAGVTAVAMLAVAAGKSVGETLFLLPALPLEYPDDQFERLDRVDAAAAYEAGAAIWDPTAIFVVASLGPQLERKLRNALPASTVVRATQLDAARDPISSGGVGRGEISVVQGALAVGEWSDSDRATNDRRAVEMHRLATDLATVVVGNGQDDDELFTIASNNDAPPAIRSWAGTFAVARRDGLVIFSDDRVIRRSARELGLKAFGTLALLDVLVDRGACSADERDSARQRLLSRGAWGVRHSVDELVRLGREANWQPTPGLRAPLGDMTAWFSLLTRWAERILAFLDAVSREAPRDMDKWVHRAVDAATHDVGGDYLSHANAFLLAAINPLEDPPRMSDNGLRALISSLRRLRYFEVFRPPHDLLVTAVAEMLATADDDRVRALIFRRISDRLGDEDQALLRQHFVR